MEFTMKPWTLLIATSLIIAAGATEVPAFEKAQYQAVKSGQKGCLWCDLSGANLTGLNLAGGDLTGADLTGADLTGVDLTNVDLTGADLTGAILTRAVLTGTNFTGADLDQVDLTGAVLTGASLEKANCDWATKFPEGAGFSCVGVTIERK